MCRVDAWKAEHTWALSVTVFLLSRGRQPGSVGSHGTSSMHKRNHSFLRCSKRSRGSFQSYIEIVNMLHCGLSATMTFASYDRKLGSIGRGLGLEGAEKVKWMLICLVYVYSIMIIITITRATKLNTSPLPSIFYLYTLMVTVPLQAAGCY